MTQNIQFIIDRSKAGLAESLGLDADSARIEAQCLLQAVLRVNRAWLLAHSGYTPDIEQQAHYDELLGRRMRGEPVSYILGSREFFGLNFKVTTATLIPRHDTELLVELALQRIPTRGAFRVLDLGTGSGAIALSIAHQRPDAEVVAVDASRDALDVARENALCLNIDNLRLLRSDWFSALQGERFDLIVSNPPYIAAGDVHLTLGDLRFEPRAALVSGADGLEDIRLITSQAQAHLNANCWLLFEHGYDQSVQVRNLLRQAEFIEVFSACDLAGIERVSGGRSTIMPQLSPASE